MKKIFTLVLLIISTVMLLLGCSNDTSGSSSEDPLTIWAFGSEGEKLPEMTEKYVEETGQPVEVVPIPWDQAHDKLLTAVASQEGPDLVQLGVSWIGEFAEAGALADMSEYAEQYPETFGPDEYFLATEGYMYYEDALVGIPWYVDTRVIFYRTDLLAEVGYTEAPKTWDELYDCATKLVEQGVSQYGFLVDMQDTPYLQIYQVSNGWSLFDENGELNFDDPVFQEGIEYWNQYYANELAPLDTSIDVMVGFSKGDIPMFIGGPWMIPIIQDDYPELEGKWNVAPMPAGDIQTSILGTAVWCVWEWSDQKDEAAAFIDWMNQPEQQVEWFEIAGVLPSRLEAWSDPVLAEDPYLQVFYQQLETATPFPLFPEFETINAVIMRETEKFYYGEQDIQTTVTNIINESNEAMTE